MFVFVGGDRMGDVFSLRNKWCAFGGVKGWGKGHVRGAGTSKLRQPPKTHTPLSRLITSCHHSSNH